MGEKEELYFFVGDMIMYWETLLKSKKVIFSEQVNQAILQETRSIYNI